MNTDQDFIKCQFFFSFFVCVTMLTVHDVRSASLEVLETLEAHPVTGHLLFFSPKIRRSCHLSNTRKDAIHLPFPFSVLELENAREAAC